MNNYVKELNSLLSEIINEEWEDLTLFYVKRGASSSFSFYYNSNKETIRFPKSKKMGSSENQNKIYYILNEIYLLESNNHDFYGFEIFLSKDMSFEMKFYSDILEKLDPSFTVMLWEHVRFNLPYDFVEFILESEKLVINDLPF